MVGASFQEFVRGLLRPGGHQYRGVVLSHPSVFQLGIFRLGYFFPLHTLTFSLKRIVSAARRITVDQMWLSPKRIIFPLSPPLGEFHFRMPRHLGTDKPIHGSAHTIFPIIFVESIILTERQTNEPCFGGLVCWHLGATSICGISGLLRFTAHVLLR